MNENAEGATRLTSAVLDELSKEQHQELVRA